MADIGPSKLWCFASGTILDTSRGPVAVQDLQDNDMLVDGSGRLVPVQLRCSGSIRHITAHDRRRSHPVLIQANAIADGVPRRPLLLPATARAHIPGFGLAEAADLANGNTITRPTPDSAASCWHGIVCEAGFALTIAGLKVEGTSMGDHAGRDAMREAGAMLQALVHPPTEPAPQFDLADHSRLAAPRRAMADRALRLGHDRIADPDLLLRVGGDVVAPECQGHWCRFELPGHPPPRVTLLSRHAVPALLIGNDEHRRLGVAVSRIMAGRRPIPLTHWSLDCGWHAPEHSWRWTDGAATVRLPPGVTTLAFEIANTLPFYPLV